MEIIAYHGWGFSDDIWTSWEKILPNGITFKAASRGYFNKVTKPEFSESASKKILFLHSFGLHWCPKKQLQQADVIVLFNCFEQFHSKNKAEKKASNRVLNRMISAFKKTPEEVLQKFWKLTFHPASVGIFSSGELNKSLLLNDLDLLNNSKINLEDLLCKKSMILDGGEDKILGRPRGNDFIIQGDAEYHFIKQAGHALPFTHILDSLSYIKARIPIFRNYGN